MNTDKRQNYYNIKKIFIVFIVLALFNISMGSQAEDKNNILISFRSQNESQFKFGVLNDAIFTITNTSDSAIVITRIVPTTNQAEESIKLFGSAYGSIHKAEAEDAYIYNRLSQQQTNQGFFTGFMLPGQLINILCKYKPLYQYESFCIEYHQAITIYDGTFASLKPFNVYTKGAEETEFTYYPFGTQKWLAPTDADKIGRGFSGRAVLIPGFTDMYINPLKQLSIIPIPYKESVPFTAEIAKKIAFSIGGQKEEKIVLVYSNALNGYVIQDGSTIWILANSNQKDKGKVLPVLPLTMLKDVEAFKSIRIKIGDKQTGGSPNPNPRSAEWKFWDLYPVFYGDGMYTHGEFIKISEDDLLSFLGKVKEKEGSIAEYKYFFNSRYFVLTLKDKNK